MDKFNFIFRFFSKPKQQTPTTPHANIPNNAIPDKKGFDPTYKFFISESKA